jgi:ComF family protein
MSYFSDNCMAFINDFLSLIYPRHCEACGNNLFRHEQFICNYCRLNLPRSNYHLDRSNQIHQALAGRVPLEDAICLYIYEKKGRVQRLLHSIKYQDQKELGEFLGLLYAEQLKNDCALSGVDVIIPVPLHKKKLRARGYNQSEWFAKGISRGLQRELNVTALERKVETSTQTKKKKYQRWENVEGIFQLNEPESLYGKHVLLVDDVITTGATIEASWLALKQAEGITLSVASIAFAARG